MKNFNVQPKRADLMTFRRWGRHGYSLFSALNRPVRIATLAVAYLYVSLPEATMAQSADSLNVQKKYDLDEIEVSARRAPVTYSQVARNVSVVGRDQIQAAPAASIQDVLDQVPGVDVRQRGAYGVQADISVRGGTFDQTLILLNGINVSDPQTGHLSLDLPVNLKSVKRIEVVNGPAASVYGPNAFSGVVNIITAPEKKNSVEAEFVQGAHQLSDIRAVANVYSGKFRSFVSASRQSSEGYRANTDFNNWNIFYQGLTETRRGTLDFQLGHADKGYGANSFYSPAYPNQYEKTQVTFAALKWHGNSKIHFSPDLYWRRHHDHFELFRNNAPAWYTSDNYHMTDVLGLDFNSWIQTALGKTSLGASFRSENIWSNTLGENMKDSVEVPGESGHYFTKSHSRTIISYFAEQTFRYRKFSLSAGAMANWISDLNFSWHIYPGLDVSYLLNHSLRIYASYNKSLRMPTFTDLYYSGPTNQGNAELKPERSATIEGGVRWGNAFLRAELAAYHRKGKDMIDWGKDSATDKVWTTRNLNQLTSEGIETSLHLNFSSLWGEHSFLRRFSVSYSYNRLNKSSGNYISYYSLDNLKHKLVFSLNHSIFRHIYGDWSVRFQERNGTYSHYENATYVGEASYKPFWLTDLKVYYQKRNIRIYGSASNLFDKNYVDLGNIPQPGRWIKFGLNYRVNL